MRITYDGKIELRGYPEFASPEEVEALRRAIQEVASRLHPGMTAVAIDIQDRVEFANEELPDPDWMPKVRHA